MPRATCARCCSSRICVSRPRRCGRRCPATVPLADAVANLGAVAVGVAGLATGRYDLLAPADRRTGSTSRTARRSTRSCRGWSRRRARPGRSARACPVPARRSWRSRTRWRASPGSRAPIFAAAADLDLPGRCSSSSRATRAPGSSPAGLTVALRCGGLGRDEAEDLAPGRVARVGELGGLAVEEAVRRALVGDEPMVDAGRVEGVARTARPPRAGCPPSAPPNRPRTGAVDLRRRRRPAPACRSPRSGPASRRSRSTPASPSPSVARQERHPAAQAEAEREQRRAAPAPRASGSRSAAAPDVGRDPGPRRLRDVRHVVEVVVARASARRSARTSRSPARRSRARRTAARAPRSRDGGRERRAGSRRRPRWARSARARNAAEAVAVGRGQDRARRVSSAPPAIGAIGGWLSRSKHMRRSSSGRWATVVVVRHRCRADRAGSAGTAR